PERRASGIECPPAPPRTPQPPRARDPRGKAKVRRRSAHKRPVGASGGGGSWQPPRGPCGRQGKAEQDEPEQHTQSVHAPTSATSATSSGAAGGWHRPHTQRPCTLSHHEPPPQVEQGCVG